jgi:hypothetical protein
VPLLTTVQVLLPERYNETVVEIEIPESSLLYTLCTLDFGELGLKTKRQQGLIPYIYVARSQPPATIQSSTASSILGGSATGTAQPSTQSFSSPSQRSPRHQRRPSLSRSRPNQTTPGTMVISQARPSTPPSQPQPTAQRTAAKPQPLSSTPTSRLQPTTSGTAVQPQAGPSRSPSPSLSQQSSQPVPMQSILPPQSQPQAPSSSSRTARIPKPTAPRTTPTPLPIPPTPNG